MSSQLQYIRKCNLIISSNSGDSLDVGNLRVVFKVKKSDAQTPNSAEIRIYGMANNTTRRINREFSSVTLQGGYESNFGVIFSGNIKQVRIGRENGTDSYTDISAGDGDNAYNYAIVHTTIASGSKQTDQVTACANAMSPKGIKNGYIANDNSQSLPRGKVLYGMARDYLRQSSESIGATWSIQDGRIQIIQRTALLPAQVVVLNSKSGLIGTPEQTNDGLRARCLLNPLLRIGGRVKIDEENVLRARVPNTEVANQVNRSSGTLYDGVYRLLAVEHTGDSHGNDWYSDIVCLDVDASAPSGQQVAKT